MANKIKPIVTSRDLFIRRVKYDIWNSLHEAASTELKRVTDILRDNPEIGMLMRKGKPVYYVNHPTYVEAEDPSDLIPEPHPDDGRVEFPNGEFPPGAHGDSVRSRDS